MIAQLLYDQVSLPGTSPRAQWRRRWADRLRRVYVSRVGDTEVRYRRWDLHLPLSHNLGFYQGLFPFYGTQLPRIVAAVKEKYPDLRCIDVATLGVSFVVSVGLAALSYFGVERLLLLWGHGFRYRQRPGAEDQDVRSLTMARQTTQRM